MEFFLIVVAGLIFYFCPTFVAAGRDHHNVAAIFVLNLLLGWTFIGWVAALVWSLTAITKAPPPAKPDPRTGWPR